MKLAVLVVVFAFGFLDEIARSDGARILVINPSWSHSHQVPFQQLIIELSKRGHDVVFVTAETIPDVNLKNLKQINIDCNYATAQKYNFVDLRFRGIPWIEFVELYLMDLFEESVETVMNNTDVIQFSKPNSGETFDVVMIEMLGMPALGAFAHRFNAPLIGLSSLGFYSINEYALGGLVMPSHERTWEMEQNTGGHQPFWRRLKNFFTLWGVIHRIYNDWFPRQQILAEKFFGKPLPPLYDILKNTSLVFVNEDDPIIPARPRLANIIPFTSFHVAKKPKPLPEDVKRFVDNAKEGFIYMSFGGNAKSKDLPEETLQKFRDVFAKLPYKVVWKFENDMTSTDNIFYGKWLPQQSILAHPNIKLFIYQGGLQSSEEAVEFEVPMLAFPILSDQQYQSRRMVEMGVAKRMDIVNLGRTDLEANIMEMITNPTYKKKVVELKKLVNDKPYDIVKHLAWWTEYVIRHKGAPGLRSVYVDLPWYQRYDRDVLMFVTAVSVVAIIIIVSLIALLLVRVYKHFARPQVKKLKRK